MIKWRIDYKCESQRGTVRHVIKPMPDDFDEWYFRWRRNEITGREMAAHCGVHISTVYNRVRERGLPFESMTGNPSRYANKRTEAEKTPSR